MPDPNAKQSETEEAFKGVLEDMALVIRKLAPYCKTVEELAAMVEHGADNPGLMRLLLYGIKDQQGKK